MNGERELVQCVLGLPCPLGVVLGLLALLERVDGLPVARGDRKHLAAHVDLRFPPGQLQRGVDPKSFGALDEGLGGEKVRRRETLRLHGGAAVVAGGDGGVGGLLEQGLTFRAHAQLIAQFLTGAIFRAFTNRSDSLEPEREGGRLHDGSIGKWGLDLK